MKIVTIEEMRELERGSAEEGVSPDMLMENAGLAVARVAWRLVESRQGTPILVLVGPGNNGGDGLVAARHLSLWGAQVTACLCTSRPEDDPKLRLATEARVRVVQSEEDSGLVELQKSLNSVRLVVDAVLGTGRLRPIQGPIQDILQQTSEARSRRQDMAVLAVDLPSGLNADTGEMDAFCPRADVTVTLGYPKPGLFLFPGADLVGRLEVVDIGIPPHLAQSIQRELLTPEWVRSVLPPRPLNAHKGTFGHLLVVAGSRDYIGAAYLACMGAYRVGAGYVTLATLPSILPALAAKLTEVTYLHLPETTRGALSPEAARILRQATERYDTLLIGCGLGQSPANEALVRQLLTGEPPLTARLVLDADALNLLSQIPEWWQHLKGPTVVTPHPGEMARLLDRDTSAVQEDRLGVALEASGQWGVPVVLKGAFTVVASPQGEVRISPFANPGLASAGTGDVLAGVIAGLLAQGVAAFDAAAAGVYLHAAAGETVRQEMGDAGMLASDLLPTLPHVIRNVKAGTFPWLR